MLVYTDTESQLKNGEEINSINVNDDVGDDSREDIFDGNILLSNTT